jgi:glycosyltransferase involved in cell wall biosynthesis
LHQKLNTYKKHLSKIVVPSRFFMEKFIEWGWPRDKFVYIPNYIDASRFTPNYEPGNYFLFFGRLAQEKGVATLLRAAKQAGIKLKIAGTGPEEAAMHALQAELQGDVEFLGYQSGAALHALIAGARAIVLPSEWYENAPMSILESYGFGKPVIGANIGGIPEMIEDGLTGWQFESRNVGDLAAVLSRVNAMSDADVTKHGKAGRALVEERFNRAGYVNATLKMYADLGLKT